MNSPVGTYVGVAHIASTNYLSPLAMPVYAPSLFDRHLVASLRAESHRFRLDHDTPESISFARAVGIFAFGEHASLPS